QDVDGLRDVFRQNRSVEDCVFFTGEGVVVSADPIKVPVNVEGSASWRSLEHHVLQEVGHAGDVRSFIPRARTNEKAQRYGARRGTGFANDLQTIIENLTAERHGFLL